MPHATRRVGDTEVTVLCDAVVTGGGTLEESFPTVPTSAWAASLERFGDTLSADGLWQLHIHAQLVRTPDTLAMIDCGVGPADAPAFAWTGTSGRLLDELSDAGVAPGDIGVVGITHVHDDHLGWTLTAEGEPVFPNARYLLQRADWDFIHADLDSEDAEIAARTLDPLQSHGVLALLDGDTRIDPRLRVRHAPGHTPGHQITFVEDADTTLLLSADTANHPAQLLNPAWFGTSDNDPEGAATTRASILGEASDRGWLVSTAHLSDPFGRFVRAGDAWDWESDPG